MIFFFYSSLANNVSSLRVLEQQWYQGIFIFNKNQWKIIRCQSDSSDSRARSLQRHLYKAVHHRLCQQMSPTPSFLSKMLIKPRLSMLWERSEVYECDQRLQYVLQ